MNDAGDEVQVRKRKTKAKIEEERCREELRKVLETKGGRYFIWRLLSECGVFHSMSSDSPQFMAIRSGRRDVGLWALNELMAVDPKIFYVMSTEANEREMTDDNRE